jgi:hypothetical protein
VVGFDISGVEHSDFAFQVLVFDTLYRYEADGQFTGFLMTVYQLHVLGG